MITMECVLAPLAAPTRPHRMRAHAATALLAALLAATSGAVAGASERPAAPDGSPKATIRVSADQAERRMSSCLRTAPRSADHHERHALACLDQVTAGRL
jgi:hypothetical protein